MGSKIDFTFEKKLQQIADDRAERQKEGPDELPVLPPPPKPESGSSPNLPPLPKSGSDKPPLPKPGGLPPLPKGASIEDEADQQTRDQEREDA